MVGWERLFRPRKVKDAAFKLGPSGATLLATDTGKDQGGPAIIPGQGGETFITAATDRLDVVREQTAQAADAAMWQRIHAQIMSKAERGESPIGGICGP